MYRKTAEFWRVNTGLIEKYYFFDEERSIGGGFEIRRRFWKSFVAP